MQICSNKCFEEKYMVKANLQISTSYSKLKNLLLWKKCEGHLKHFLLSRTKICTNVLKQFFL